MSYTLGDLDVMLDYGHDTFRHYYPIATGRPIGRLKEKMISPFQRGNGFEKDPSFSIYLHRNKGTVFFKDQGIDKTGTHWQFVMDLFGIDFKTAVAKVKAEVLQIGKTAELPVRVIQNLRRERPVEVVKRVEIHPVYKDFTQEDIDFYKQFKISQSTLDLFKCGSVNHYDLIRDNKTIRISNRNSLMYGFEINGRTKIYQPFAEEKRYKWTSNLIADEDVFGLDLVKKECEHLFIIGGNKDAMSFYENIGHPVIALASESTNLTDSLFTFLKHVSKNIWILYDNDTQGYRKAQKFEDEYHIPSLNHLLKDYNVKDFAEFVHKCPDEIGKFSFFLDQNINKMNEQ